VALIKPHDKGWHLNFWESFYIQAYQQNGVIIDEQSAYDHQLFTIKQDTPYNRAHERGMPKDTTCIQGHKRTSSRLIPTQYIRYITSHRVCILNYFAFTVRLLMNYDLK